MANVDELMQKGMAALQTGRLKDAERCFRKVTEVAPRHFGALNLQVVALTALEHFDEAEAVAERALRIDASSDSTHYNYGTVLKRNNKPQQAIAAFDAALSINPRHVKALINRGAAYSQLKRYEDAIADFDRAIALERSYSEVFYNKANALMELKRRDEALRNFELALSRNPRHAGAYANLLILLYELGQYDKALECGRRAVALDPGSVDAYLNLAAAEQARGQFEAALRWLDELLARAPNAILALSARIRVLLELNRLDDARIDAARLKALTPQDERDAAAREGAIATLLLAEDRYEEAMAALDRAIASEGSFREKLMVVRADAMATFGRQDEAVAAFDEALALDPDSTGALCGRAKLVSFTADDWTIAAMEALLARGTDFSSGISLHFALGKAYLDLGDSPAAFRHFDEGNRMLRAIVPYSADATRKHFAEIADAFTSELLDRLSGLGARSSAPIFIVGMPRSGTTLIEQILAAHPAVRGAGELLYMAEIVAQIGDVMKNVATLDASALRQLGEGYLSRLSAVAKGKPRVVDKQMANFINVGLIRLILPDAKIIYARRNPVDICLSCYTHPLGGALSYACDQTDLGRYCRDFLKLMDHWRAVLPASHFLEVDYETVVEDVEGEARRMLAFLDLPWQPACLEFYRVERAVRTPSAGQVRQPIYRSSRGRWRKHAGQLRPLLQALAIEGD